MIAMDRLEDGLNQLRGAAKRFDRELLGAQKRIRTLRAKWTKKVQKRTQAGLREAQERADALRAQVESTLAENPVASRLEDLRNSAGERLSRGLERAIAALPVASRSEVDQMQRKLNRLQRKLRNIEKTQSA